jgi:iron complex transport system substrate-binding protein
LFLGFTQCKKSENVANQNTSVRNSIQYAEGFSIEKYSSDLFLTEKISNGFALVATS